jgi:hypothetical protein
MMTSKLLFFQSRDTATTGFTNNLSSVSLPPAPAVETEGVVSVEEMLKKGQIEGRKTEKIGGRIWSCRFFISLAETLMSFAVGFIFPFTIGGPTGIVLANSGLIFIPAVLIPLNTQIGILIYMVFRGMGKAYCAGVPHTEIMKRFQNIDSDDTRSYLLQHWKDMEALARTCEKGKLPSATDGYELVQQLYPAQIQSLLQALKVGLETTPRPRGGEESAEGEESGRDLGQAFADIERLTSNLLKVFKGILPSLSLLTGIGIPLSMPIEEAVEVLFSLKLSPEAQTYYSSQILEQTTPLLKAYAEAFKQLPNNPEFFFTEPELGCGSTPSAEIEISEAETAAVQAITAKTKRAFAIAKYITKARKKMRRNANNSDQQVNEDAGPDTDT